MPGAAIGLTAGTTTWALARLLTDFVITDEHLPSLATQVFADLDVELRLV